MESYGPYNRRNNLSTARNHVSVPGQSDKARDRRAATTDAIPDSPPRTYTKSAFNADDTVHHRRPRAGVHRARGSTPRVMIVNEQARPSALGDLKANDLQQDMELLEANDLRQHVEIWKQQQEIERLERELERHIKATRKEKTTAWKQSDIPRDGGDWLEEEIKYRPRLEQENRRKNEEQDAEIRWRIEKLDKLELEAAQKRQLEMKMHETELKEFLQHKKEAEEREKIAQEIRNEEARRVFEEQKRREHEATIRHAAVEDYKMFEKQSRVDEEQLRKKIEREVRAQIEVELGQSLEQVKAILSKALSEQNDSAERLTRDSHTCSPSMSVGHK